MSTNVAGRYKSKQRAKPVLLAVVALLVAVVAGLAIAVSVKKAKSPIVSETESEIILSAEGDEYEQLAFIAEHKLLARGYVEVRKDPSIENARYLWILRSEAKTKNGEVHSVHLVAKNEQWNEGRKWIITNLTIDHKRII